MTLVLVERSFEAPTDLAALTAQEHGGAWCLEQHRVRFLRTHVATDHLRMLCVYEAPDAESVRLAQRTIGMPVSSVWPAQVLKEAPCAPGCAVLERAYESALSLEDFERSRLKMDWCFEMHRVSWVNSYRSLDGTRLVCLFDAPDLESVRLAGQKAELHSGRLYGAKTFEASALTPR